MTVARHLPLASTRNYAAPSFRLRLKSQPYKPADGFEAVEQWRSQSASDKIQHPRQMVFNLASNFEFSTASISTPSLCSGGDVDAAVGEGGNLCFTGFAAIGGVALS